MRPTGAEGHACPICARTLRVLDGILVDSALPAMANLLEEIDYDARHGVSRAASANLGDHWWRLLQQEFGERDDLELLEIGAGSGLLTLGLATRGRFGRLYVSDVSRVFLAANRRTAFESGADAAAHVTWLASSVDDLPFRSGTLDVVVGNSVLHHIYDYRGALAALARLLRPGGVAILGEPVLQGKVYVGLLARMVREFDMRQPSPRFSADEHRLLRDLATLCRREFWRTAAEIERETANDKHLFDLEEIRVLAPTLGFAVVEARPWKVIDDGFLAEFHGSLRIMGIREEPLAAYRFLFEIVQQQMVSQLGASVPTAFAHLILRKERDLRRAQGAAVSIGG
ncbi:MAG TPA: methyltransferase domain-containing protein [Acetobacteraceae bacterium]|nr:methyltransferase domain-containing protein [Acetobacteraceae bacterium]